MPLMRLDKFFSSQDILTRKQVKTAIKKGLIKINDKIACSSEVKINTDQDDIYLKDKHIIYKPYVYIMLNKPLGVVSATDDKINKTVLDLVPKELMRSGLFPAGRLDKDTVGFVLITNDGDFAHKMLSPKNQVVKKYQARLENAITLADIETIEKGITLLDGTVCLPSKVIVIEKGTNKSGPLVEISICEGKYHQVKRMFAAVGNKVITLKRTSIGNLELDKKLQEGQCKEIMHKELEEILVKNLSNTT